MRKRPTIVIVVEPSSWLHSLVDTAPNQEASIALVAKIASDGGVLESETPFGLAGEDFFFVYGPTGIQTASERLAVSWSLQ